MITSLNKMAALVVILVCSINSGFTKDFYIGVYLYDYEMIKAAKSWETEPNKFIEEHLKILKQNGVNVVHLTVQKEDNWVNIFLPLLIKYDIKALLQLDFAYYQAETNWNEELENQLSKKAGEFIEKYSNNPQVIAFSVREEVAQKDIHTLSRYYQKILGYAPNGKFFIVHSSLGAAKDQPVPDPVILGTDRYCFWWEFSAEGYLASPAFSLNWLREQAAEFSQEAAKRGSDFMFVTTQGGYVFATNDPAGMVQNIFKRKTTDENETLVKKILGYAKESKMGWQEFNNPEKKTYVCWKWYRLPQNCMKAAAWGSVMEGAKSFLCWSYSPPTKNFASLNLRDEVIAKLKTSTKTKIEINYYTLAGRPGKPNQQLAEFSDASREIRKYENIITQMSKLPDSPVVTDKKRNIHNRAFSFPGCRGKIIVIHNANVGIWPHNSKYFFDKDDNIKIDSEGNLMDYTPYDKPLEITFTTQSDAHQWAIYNLATGEKIVKENGVYPISIMPGSGQFIYIGYPDEFASLRKLVKP